MYGVGSTLYDFPNLKWPYLCLHTTHANNFGTSKGTTNAFLSNKSRVRRCCVGGDMVEFSKTYKVGPIPIKAYAFHLKNILITNRKNENVIVYES